MSEKVKLPREVAEAIESLRNHNVGFSDYAIIGMLYKPLEHLSVVDIQTLDRHMGQGKMHPDDLIKALVNGYEVEESKEDKVRKVISEFCRGAIVSNLVIDEIKSIYEGVND